MLPEREDHFASPSQDLPQAVNFPRNESNPTTPFGTDNTSYLTARNELEYGKRESHKPRRDRLARNLIVAGGLIILICLGTLIVTQSFFGPNYYALAPEALKGGDIDLAEKYYRLGLQQAIRKDRHFFIAVTHQGLASVAFERKNWAEAEQEARTAIAEFLCPDNENIKSNNYNLNGCFQTMGYAQTLQRKYEEGVRNVEEADIINAELTKGFNEPSASIEMAKFYRLVASSSQEAHYYSKAMQRITKAEDLILSLKYNYLRDTIAHANILREKAIIVREAGFTGVNPDDIDFEANRMEETFYARERANQARHKLPGK